MKPNTMDRIHVRPAAWEQAQEAAPFFDGIWFLYLDERTVAFVPAVARSPWPPTLPKDTDDIRSSDDARRLSLLSRFAITPDASRAGTSETVTASDGMTSTILYCDEAEFQRASAQLAELSERTPGVHDSIPLDDVRDTPVFRLVAKVVGRVGTTSQRLPG